MTDASTVDQDLASAYEALVEFLYLTPIGIIKFRADGGIDMANPTAAQLLMPLVFDWDMSNLFRLLVPIAPDLRLHVQRFQEPTGPIVAEMQLFIPSTKNTLMLDINKINDTVLMAVIQNVSDLTEARREVVRRTESQRLLASVFMRLNTPVVVNRADGMIVLSNPAFQRLMGYDSKSLTGLSLDALIPPDAQGAARAALTQQIIDGKSYEVDIEVVAKSGARFPVGLHSALLDEADAKQLRVVTLFQIEPRPVLAAQTSYLQGRAEFPVNDWGIVQVRTIKTSQFRTAIGGDWVNISARALMLVEDILKMLFAPSDIIKRGKDDSFIVWFSGGDPTHNAAILARAEQAVRRVFVTEFGSKIADRVIAAVAA